MAVGQPAGGGGGILAFFPMILMFAIIYFLLIRPQMKRQSRQREMLNTLAKGDHVVTRGGLLGKIEAFKGKDDQQVIIDLGKGLKVTVARPYIVGPAADTIAPPRDR